MNTNSKVWLTVVMPVYNGASTLADSLSSIDTEDSGIEVVIVDQGSTDGSADIARSFSDRLNLFIVDAPQNKNWMQNTNLGMKMGRGIYATMLHQDDLWYPGRCSLLRRLLALSEGAALWAHASSYINANGCRIGSIAAPFGRKEQIIPSAQARQALYVQNTLSVPAVMFRRQQFLDMHGLDETLWYTADWELWLRLLTTGPMVWSGGEETAFRIHSGSLTVTGSKSSQAFAEQFDTVLSRCKHDMPSAVRSRAVLSARINVWLAARYHGDRPALISILWAILGLGPLGWWRLLRETQLLKRVLPRLRLPRISLQKFRNK